MKTILATMVRDEADRYWRSALETWSSFADQILVLDDLSEDDTRKIAREFPKVEDISPPGSYTRAWGDESRYREYLFKQAWHRAEIGDVIFWEDADMVPANDPRPYFELLPEVDAFAFILYDLWESVDGRLRHRFEPPFWQAPITPRLWAIRKTDLQAELSNNGERYEWSGRKIHCGHLPSNYHSLQTCFMPSDYGILHYGYVNPRDREEKAERYTSVKHRLTPQELKHARTIDDGEPQLWQLSFAPRYTLERAK